MTEQPSAPSPLDDEPALPPSGRRIYCNRTLNLRSIQAVGFDMDYTLIHYRPEEWELQAYDHMKGRLVARGWPVGHLCFDPDLVSLGLILDLQLGNLVKANRFGFVKKAIHGTQRLSFSEIRDAYAQEVIDLSEPRWVFMNTLFGLSEACMYAQAVDLLDAGELEAAMGYRELYEVVKSSLDEAHMEGQLKAEVMADPDRFVDLDPELPLALLDLKHAGKKLLLITNSEWYYTSAMMRYAFDALLPEGMVWRDLFDLVIVRATKPAFFTSRPPFLELVDPEQEHLKLAPAGPEPGGIYVGGNAAGVEQMLALAGEKILYIGDHIYADVHVSKSLLRWRTGLVVRSLEAELEALESFKDDQSRLNDLMQEKERLEHHFSLLRLELQRLEKGYGPASTREPGALKKAMQALRARLVELDAGIAPLVRDATSLAHPLWGPLMRAGNDKSHLARQIERSADIYTSRVSNLMLQTPFVYLRSARGSLPHDPVVTPHQAPEGFIDT